MANDLVRAIDDLLQFVDEVQTRPSSVLADEETETLKELDATVFALCQQAGLTLPTFSETVPEHSFEFGNTRLLATWVLAGLTIFATTNWEQSLRTLKATAERTPLRETEDLDQMLSAPALSQRYEVDPEKLRKRLDYWRSQNKGSKDWTEVENRAENEPKYLYRLGAALEIVNALKTDA